MHLAADPLGATHSLLGDTPAGPGGPRIEVPLRTGDGVLAAERLPVPTVVKIDVEGFEEDVVSGMRGVLASRTCRALFIEVHFALLEARKTPDAPARIVAELRGHGFRTRWLDPSHLMGWR